jgi:hypothetical protein
MTQQAFQLINPAGLYDPGADRLLPCGAAGGGLATGASGRPGRPRRRGPARGHRSIWRRAFTTCSLSDVRRGNLKRVASAVGEGSTAVALVHQVLKE